ncbi:MAG: class II glutamine amidotransferase [Slackia sp.]
MRRIRPVLASADRRRQHGLLRPARAAAPRPRKLRHSLQRRRGLRLAQRPRACRRRLFGRVLKAFPPCSIAIGHVRYATTGAGNRSNCQPLEVNHQKGSMAIAHNGNLSNADVLRDELELSGAIFHTTSDTETIAYLATRERLSAPSIEEALARTMDFLEGAYSLIVMSAQKLVCVETRKDSTRFASAKRPTTPMSSLPAAP